MGNYLRGLAPAVQHTYRSDVRYVCPECSGQLSYSHGLVVACWACEGVGSLSADEMSVYGVRQRARVAEGLQA